MCQFVGSNNYHVQHCNHYLQSVSESMTSFLSHTIYNIFRVSGISNFRVLNVTPHLFISEADSETVSKGHNKQYMI